MATAQEKDKLSSLDRRMTRLEVRVDEVIVPILTKVDKFVDDNKSGIKTASLLNNQILTVVIAAIIGAGVLYLISKGASAPVTGSPQAVAQAPTATTPAPSTPPVNQPATPSPAPAQPADDRSALGRLPVVGGLFDALGL